MANKRPVNERLLPRHKDVKVIGMRTGETVETFIKRRRLQMMIFCYITTAYSRGAIPDRLAEVISGAWTLWAEQLVRAQKYHKDPTGYHDEAFKDWGLDKLLDLPHDEYVIKKSREMLIVYS